LEAATTLSPATRSAVITIAATAPKAGVSGKVEGGEDISVADRVGVGVRVEVGKLVAVGNLVGVGVGRTAVGVKAAWINSC